MLFSKAIAATTFALIAFLGACDLVGGNTSIFAIAIVAIAFLAAIGFGFGAWADI